MEINGTEPIKSSQHGLSSSHLSYPSATPYPLPAMAGFSQGMRWNVHLWVPACWAMNWQGLLPSPTATAMSPAAGQYPVPSSRKASG